MVNNPPFSSPDQAATFDYIFGLIRDQGRERKEEVRLFLLESLDRETSAVWRKTAFWCLQSLYMRLFIDDDEKLREYLRLGEVWAAEDSSETPFIFLSNVAGLLREGAAGVLADLHARACVRVMARPDGPDRRSALYDCHTSFLSSCRNASDWPGVARCLSAIVALGPVPSRVRERLAPELAAVPAGVVPSDLLAAFDLPEGERPS